MKNIHVLVIDDSEGLREVLRSMLTQLGAEVTCADNGFQGIQLLSQLSIDVIFCDIHLGDVTGIQFVSELRKFESDASYRSPLFSEDSLRDTFTLYDRHHEVYLISGDERQEALLPASLDVRKLLLKPIGIQALQDSLEAYKQSLQTAPVVLQTEHLSQEVCVQNIQKQFNVAETQAISLYSLLYKELNSSVLAICESTDAAELLKVFHILKTTLRSLGFCQAGDKIQSSSEALRMVPEQFSTLKIEAKLDLEEIINQL